MGRGPPLLDALLGALRGRDDGGAGTVHGGDCGFASVLELASGLFGSLLDCRARLFRRSAGARQRIVNLLAAALKQTGLGGSGRVLLVSVARVLRSKCRDNSSVKEQC